MSEATCRVIDRLIAERYGNDRMRFLAETSSDELSAPITDLIAGHKFEMSLATPTARLGFYAILSIYHRAKKLCFNYSRKCFAGPAQARSRRLSGEFSSYDLSVMRREDGSYDTAIFGLPQFQSDGKAAIRAAQCDFASRALGEREVLYLGLETEKFLSLRRFISELNIVGKQSTVIEREERVLAAMKATRKVDKSEAGSIIREVELVHGSVDEAVRDLKNRYNLVNFDFLGHLSIDKEKAIRALFEHGLIADNAVIFITIADDGIDRKRAQHCGYSSDQAAELGRIIKSAAEQGFTLDASFTLPYSGGTGTARARAMVTLGFSLTKSLG